MYEFTKYGTCCISHEDLDNDYTVSGKTKKQVVSVLKSLIKIHKLTPSDLLTKVTKDEHKLNKILLRAMKE